MEPPLKHLFKKIPAATLALALLLWPCLSGALNMPPTPTPFRGPVRTVYHGLKYVRSPMRPSGKSRAPKWFPFYPTPTPANPRGMKHPPFRGAWGTESAAPLNNGPALTPVPTPTPFSAWNWNWKKGYETLYQDLRRKPPQGQATPPPVLQKQLPSP